MDATFFRAKTCICEEIWGLHPRLISGTPHDQPWLQAFFQYFVAGWRQGTVLGKARADVHQDQGQSRVAWKI